MKASGATVHILKIAAARRQLDAAVRMTFANEDPLAVHTIAAAACRILRDLKKKRGHNVFTDGWRTNLLSIAP